MCREGYKIFIISCVFYKIKCFLQGKHMTASKFLVYRNKYSQFLEFNERNYDRECKDCSSHKLISYLRKISIFNLQK